MPRVHICLTCGFDLARERVARDPIYGLPIVRCPNCTTIAVRTQPAALRAWKWFLRLDWVLSTIFVQLHLLAGAVLGVILFLTVAVGIRADVLRGRPVRPEELTFLATLFIVFSIVKGMWLTASFSHWRRGTPWITWWITWFIGLHLVPLFAFSTVDVHWPANVQRRPPDDITAMRWLWLHMTVPGVQLVTIMLVFATLGIPPGMLLVRGMRYLRRVRWRLRRRRHRSAMTQN